MNGAVQVPRGLIILLTVVTVVAVLHYAQDVFIPLALAILLTFLLAPVVERLQRWGINRAVGVVISVAVAFCIIAGLVYVVVDQLADLVAQLPRYRQQLTENLAEITGAVRGGVSETTQAVEALTRDIERMAPSERKPGVQMVQVVEPPPGLMESLRNRLGPLIGPFGTAAIVVVFVIFMLLRLPDLRDRLIRLLGAGNLRATTEALEDAARRVSRYLLMQTVINGWQGVFVTLGLMVIGLPNAILWGALTVVLRFIPYVGPWVAAGMPIALSFAVFDNWTQPLLTVGWLVLLELISNVVLEPWLYGSRTGVSPVALLVAAAFWTWLWGGVGLLLAIPITVCLVVMGKYIPQLGFLQILLGDEPVLQPHERLYQRLLASNRDEADDLLDEELGSRTFLEVCDLVVLPALQLTETDYERGMLAEAKRQSVLDHLDQWIGELTEEGGMPPKSDTREPEAQDQEEGEPPRTRISIAGLSVVCVPAADQADEVAAKLLAAVLQERGAEAMVSPAGALDGLSHVDVVVVSAIPPEAVLPARRVCRQARARLGPVPIIVGLWYASGDLQRCWQRLAPAGASRIVTSIGQCLTECEAGLEALSGPPQEPAPRSTPQAEASHA